MANMYGGVPGGVSSVREGSPQPWGGMVGGGGGQYVGGMGGGYASPRASDINALNYVTTHNAMVADPAYQAAQGFLNPNNPTAMYDVAMQGAEHAAGSGIGGSGVAGQYTGRLRQYDIERRAALGNQLLSGAYSRQPGLVNPSMPRANQENNRLLNDISSRYAPTGFSQGGGYGGGGRSAPMVIGAGGTGGGGYSPASSLAAPPPTVVTNPGDDQVAYGIYGPTFNANQQTSQRGEVPQGESYFGAADAMPVPYSQLSFEEQQSLYE